MSLTLTLTERLARARGDLRMGVPVVLTEGTAAALVVATEALTPARLAQLRAMGAPELAITARRAATLKVAAYHGDLARLALPPGVGVDWVAAVADPVDDLRLPMKGPFRSLREGGAGLHRAALLTDTGPLRNKHQPSKSEMPALLNYDAMADVVFWLASVAARLARGDAPLE